MASRKEKSGSLGLVQVPPGEQKGEEKIERWEYYIKYFNKLLESLKSLPKKERDIFEKLVTKYYSTGAVAYAAFRLEFEESVKNLIDRETDNKHKKELVSKLKKANALIKNLNERLLEFNNRYDTTKLPDEFKGPRIGQFALEIEMAKLCVILSAFIYDEKTFATEIENKIKKNEKINLSPILGIDMYASTSYMTTLDKYIFEIFGEITKKKSSELNFDEIKVKELMESSIKIQNPTRRADLEELKLWGLTTYPDRVQFFKDNSEFRRTLAEEWKLKIENLSDEKEIDKEIKRKLLDFLVSVNNKKAIFYYIDPEKNCYVDKAGNPTDFALWYGFSKSINLGRVMEYRNKIFKFLETKVVSRRLDFARSKGLTDSEVEKISKNIIEGRGLTDAQVQFLRSKGLTEEEIAFLREAVTTKQYIEILTNSTKILPTLYNSMNHAFIYPATRLEEKDGKEALKISLQALERVYYDVFDTAIVKSFEEASKMGVDYFVPTVICKLNAISGFEENRNRIIEIYKSKNINVKFKDTEFPLFVPNHGIVIVKTDTPSSLVRIAKKEYITLEDIRKEYKNLNIGNYTTYICEYSVKVDTKQAFDKYPKITVSVTREEIAKNVTKDTPTESRINEYPPIAEISAITGYKPKAVNYISLELLKKSFLGWLAGNIEEDRCPVDISKDGVYELELKLPKGHPPVFWLELVPHSNLNTKVSLGEEVEYPVEIKPFVRVILPPVKGEYRILSPTVVLPPIIKMNDKAKMILEEIRKCEIRSVEDTITLGKLTKDFIEALDPKYRDDVKSYLSSVTQVTQLDLWANSVFAGMTVGKVTLNFGCSTSGKVTTDFNEIQKLKYGVGSEEYYITEDTLRAVGNMVKIDDREVYLDVKKNVVKEGGENGKILEDFILSSEIRKIGGESKKVYYVYRLTSKAEESITFNFGISYEKFGKIKIDIDPKFKQYMLNWEWYEKTLDEIFKSSVSSFRKFLSLFNNIYLYMTEFPDGRYVTLGGVLSPYVRQDIKIPDLKIKGRKIPSSTLSLNLTSFRVSYSSDTGEIKFEGFPEFLIDLQPLGKPIHLSYHKSKEREAFILSGDYITKNNKIKLTGSIHYEPGRNYMGFNVGILYK